MGLYLFRKLAYGISVLFGVVTLVFFIFNLSPSDPARILAGQNDSEETLQAIRKELGLDLSVGGRYALYINDLSPLSVHSDQPESRVFWDESEYKGIQLLQVGDRILAIKFPYLRRSYISKRPVVSILSDAMPGTALLAITAIVIALVLGIGFGVLSALRKDGLLDRTVLVLSAVGMSGPSFFMAILVAWLGGLVWSESVQIALLPFIVALLSFFTAHLRKVDSGKWAWYGLLIGFGYQMAGMLAGGLPGTGWMLHLPGTGLSMTGSLYSVDVWKGEYLDIRNLILPALTLGIRPLSVVIQLTRNSLLDVLQTDFIRTARAKGLSNYRVVLVHALRNALNPVVTAISGWFASLLAGAVFVEFVFGWKGLGMEVFTALEQEDLPVVMGAVLLIASLFVLINVAVDVIYGLLDPRVRLS